ncbi:LacI family DNA-binding transcriptional regulator [Cohnella yongneupensis]|uniref:LacI family DNA-binding transcriptional regulator n=1 Tax=Cohnella yongneupensis TaxID=425006 RepID=A0ABW0R352_9BACL
MKANIFDVAKKSGLSVVTVSRVLNNAASVRQSNRDKVLKAMEELDYRPNASARSLAKGRTGVIGLTLTTLHDAFLDTVVKEITDCLAEQGYFLALSVAPSFEASHQSLFQHDRVDGVILLSPVEEDAYVRELKQKRIPFVMLDNQHQDPSVTSILVDNFRGGYEATKHLIELGHNKIAHIRGSASFLSSRNRERGFMTAMAESGLEPYCIEDGEFDIASGYEVASRWIEDGRLPTAVFAADDYIAIGVMDACKNAGLKVPVDLSVVGFDDQLLASQLRPYLTTVRQPARALGQTGAELLLGYIDGAPASGESVLLSPELIVRASTAAPRTNHHEQEGDR